MKSKLPLILLTLFFLSSLGFSQGRVWEKSSSDGNLNSIEISDLDTNHFEVFKLNFQSFKEGLNNIPLRGSSTSFSNSIIQIPNQKGILESFKLYEAPVFSPGLSAKYPNIKSYVGYSTDNSGTRIRMSVSPQGVQAMISYLDKPMVFIQPVKNSDNDYIIYNRQARDEYVDNFRCYTIDEYTKFADEDTLFNKDADDQLLRQFRLAISVNGEYTAYHGGTVAGALAAINATLTRVNEVFETDMAVTFELVDAEELIYTDPATDPYSSMGNWNGELQSTLTSVIGEAAYDIGHMFGGSGGGGNAGCIGCVCVDGQKGSGITSPADAIPEGDNFDIDYVAHEIGHQVGANHTFAFTTEGTGVNAEPGSGTTIMGYAGITGSNDVEMHSDPYFHYHSINQILNNLENQTCWTSTAITNNPPSADAGNDYTIPQGTAYVLRGSATDADSGDTLMYCWEQTDSGQVTSSGFSSTIASGSMNRSLPPTTSPDRYIPNVNRVIAGQLTETNPTVGSDWETVATVGRTMNWALTVRDREPTATGLNGQSSFDLMQITVDANSGPFAVTSQSTSETWDAGSTQTITWDVAGTDGGAVNTPTVNILVSADGGLTFPFVMASDVPNDGSHDAAVPVIGGDTTMARIKVEGNNNIFYAINSANLTIQESEFVLSVAESSVDVCSPNDATYTFTYNTFLGFTGTTDFTATGLPSGASATFSPSSASSDGTMVTVTVTGTSGLAAGNYPFGLTGTSGSLTQTTDVELNVFNTTFGTLNLTAPSDGATDVYADNAMFEWDADVNAASYEIDIASDSGFATIVESGTPSTNNYLTTSLLPDTQYYWRVRSINDCGNGSYSSATFTTANISCGNFDSNDTPIDIPDGNSTGVDSFITIPTTSLITDVNVTVNITHTWDDDLILTLTSPGGTSVILSNRNGGSGDNYTNTVFDQEATDLITAGSPPFTGSFQPEQDLSVLYGEFSGGTWTLNVSDNVGWDTGTIDSWSLEICGIPQLDDDEDGVPNGDDNCPDTANSDQADMDNDGIGDVCDDDIDGDGVLNVDDNCPENPNPDQADLDQDGIGDWCDVDCVSAFAEDLPITIADTGGTATYTSSVTITDVWLITDINVLINIDHDWDSDLDIYLISPNGTAIELSTGNGGGGDDYSDTVFDQEADVSITAGSPPFSGSFIPEGDLSTLYGQLSDGVWTLEVTDTFGALDGGVINNFILEVCGILDPLDYDSDGILNEDDNCLLTVNFEQSDIDGDGIGDVCDDDIDNDGLLNANDNCPETVNPDQADLDNDGIGDICDDDKDGDGVFNELDNCPETANPTQSDADMDGIGDACDGLIVNDVLSPNGDFINDTWTIFNIERYPDATVKVYNRWGNEVFASKNYNNDWRGDSDGKTLPQGSYFYQVNPGNGEAILSGWIYLTY